MLFASGEDMQRRVDELTRATSWSLLLQRCPPGCAYPGEKRWWMVKFLIFVLIVSLSVVSLFSLNGCRQDPLPKVVKELPQLPETAAGGMVRSAIEKAKGVETTLGEAGQRTAEASAKGPP